MATAVIVYAITSYFAGNRSEKISWHNLAQILGLTEPAWPLAFQAVVRPTFLTLTLFLGPLVILFFDSELPGQAAQPLQQVFVALFTLIGFRNYVFAPWTEEYVFRAAMISLLHQAGHSTAFLIFVSPLYFGLAHLHHGWQTYHQMGRTSRALKIAVASSSFQFLYTTLFGWYASFLFLRTGSIWPCVLSHMFCNAMGFPDVSDVPQRSVLQQRVIWSSFAAGIVVFICQLYPWSFVATSQYWLP
ncbi:Abi-domain-containing protein [Hesseltinella vesiculosa]|uniref:intramembrane prenyl-peptidase Rce1 n=1 Tax=Hesseltinella vesiculosa TaxID=101127 RepID=A0A1X2GRF8_9FUNG|nr:Abi-domain-containing protein [Hesseltinella vesiculosa]